MTNRSLRGPFPLAGFLVLLAAVATASTRQEPQSEEPSAVEEELTVVESSVLLQRLIKTEVEDLEVVVGGALGEAVAIYPVSEVEIPTTLYLDLCTTSFSRLVHAVTMLGEVSDRLLERGPVTVLAHVAGENEALLRSSSDGVDLEAALVSLLWKKLGGCGDPSLLGGVERLRGALDRHSAETAAASLLINSRAPKTRPSCWAGEQRMDLVS